MVWQYVGLDMTLSQSCLPSPALNEKGTPQICNLNANAYIRHSFGLESLDYCPDQSCESLDHSTARQLPMATAQLIIASSI